MNKQRNANIQKLAKWVDKHRSAVAPLPNSNAKKESQLPFYKKEK